MAEPPNSHTPFWRFNCVGFVVTAYEEAGISLLADELPLMGLNEVQQAYPQHVDKLQNPDFRKRMGIGEGDSWAIALPGHILNSVARSPEVIRSEPFCPVQGDEWFPPQRVVAQLSDDVEGS